MKILKMGKKPNKNKRTMCLNCGTKLEYSSADVNSDRDGKYIICPVCSQYLAV